MADEEHLKIIRQGAAAWNDWRENEPDLRGADLSGANLKGTILLKANLSGADCGVQEALSLCRPFP